MSVTRRQRHAPTPATRRAALHAQERNRT
jgi:hypothetical protein